MPPAATRLFKMSSPASPDTNPDEEEEAELSAEEEASLAEEFLNSVPAADVLKLEAEEEELEDEEELEEELLAWKDAACP